ncbi:hypothetical protein EC2722950_3226 [Escherichia coli 2722950]|nr:hypothetical protein EC2722950_3226 [Escherichia coli 2722950]
MPHSGVMAEKAVLQPCCRRMDGNDDVPVTQQEVLLSLLSF